MAPPYHEWTRVVTLPVRHHRLRPRRLAGRDDGSRRRSARSTGKQNVRVHHASTSCAQGDATPDGRVRLRSAACPNSFVFSPDGRFLYGSAYYTGASNIFRYEIATKKLEAVSNAETGFFRPIPLGGDELIVFRYTGEGFVPARITATPIEDVNPITFLGERTIEKHPVLKTWALGSPADVPLDSMPKTEGVYRLGGGLERESFYPIVQGYKDAAAVGMRVNFSDPLQFNRAIVSASYSPTGDLPGKERVHVRAEYQRYDWTGARVVERRRLLRSVRSDADQPQGLLDRPRPHEHADLRRAAPHDARDRGARRRQSRSAARVPERAGQGRSTRSRSPRRSTNTFVRSSLGHVDDEKRQKWTAVMRRRLRQRVDVLHARRRRTTSALALPLGHSSVWLRSAAGFSPRRSRRAVRELLLRRLRQQLRRPRRREAVPRVSSFPGAEPSTRSAAATSRGRCSSGTCRRCGSAASGTPGAYLSWLRPALFASGLVTNLDSAPDPPEGGLGRRAGRLALHGAVGARHDLLGRGRRADRGRRAGAAAKRMVSLAVLK